MFCDNEGSERYGSFIRASDDLQIVRQGGVACNIKDGPREKVRKKDTVIAGKLRTFNRYMYNLFPQKHSSGRLARETTPTGKGLRQNV